MYVLMHLLQIGENLIFGSDSCSLTGPHKQTTNGHFGSQVWAGTYTHPYLVTLHWACYYWHRWCLDLDLQISSELSLYIKYEFELKICVK